MIEKKIPRFKLVLSDFHLGKGRYFRDGSQNILEDFIYDREFSEFLNYYCSGSFREAEVELVLNGDILNLLQMDTWGVHTHLMTERSVSRSVKRIIEGHPEFFTALRNFVSVPHHFVSYVIGNHDVGMLWEKPRQIFSEAVGCLVCFYDVFYEFDGIHIEHGQQYERFSRVDPENPFITRGLPEPVLNLPWGSLFVAILLPRIKQSRPHVDKVRPFSTFLRWVFIHDFIWGIKTGLEILKFIFDTLFFKKRFQIYESMRSSLKLLFEVSLYPNYDKIAFKILESRDHINTVIFGHTHILRYRQWKKGKEYFNEGTWNETTSLDLSDYGKQIRLTYAFIEYPLEGSLQSRPLVRLKQWNGFWKPECEILI